MGIFKTVDGFEGSHRRREWCELIQSLFWYHIGVAITEMRTAGFHNREKVHPCNPYWIILQFRSMRIA